MDSEKGVPRKPASEREDKEPIEKAAHLLAKVNRAQISDADALRNASDHLFVKERSDIVGGISCADRFSLSPSLSLSPLRSIRYGVLSTLRRNIFGRNAYYS